MSYNGYMPRSGEDVSNLDAFLVLIPLIPEFSILIVHVPGFLPKSPGLTR